MKTIAIVPAYNEEKTIGDVLQALIDTPAIQSIVMVSDGSTDGTVEVARGFGVTVVDLEENMGKGGAMAAGLETTEADVILFLDADLIGLTVDHVNALLEPVISGEADMTVGIFDRGRIVTDLAQRVAPYLSGQRAVRRTLLEQISDMDISRFGVELALTQHIEEQGTRVQEVVLSDMSHVMKEEKLGLVKGLAARFKMYWEIVKYVTRMEQFK